ncbi:hypothetical protein [Paenibacillus amylolyticus]|uniref:hypothetical protein n=1 Tax=Paenibacillus amylolyticus TaxID=1451 RepID=UPI003D951715
MDEFNWITLTGFIVTTLSSLATLYFSYRLLKATEESTKAAISSAKAAEASTLIAEKIEQRSEAVSKGVRDSYILSILRHIDFIETVLKEIEGKQLNSSRKLVETRELFSTEIFAQYLSSEAMNKIEFVVSDLTDYLGFWEFSPETNSMNLKPDLDMQPFSDYKRCLSNLKSSLDKAAQSMFPEHSAAN